MDTERLWHAVFEGSGDGILIVKRGLIAECNPAALSMLGCTREQIIGHAPTEFFPHMQPEGQPSLERANEIAQLAMSGAIQRGEWRYLRSDGSAMDAEVTTVAVGDPGDRYLLATMRDIGQRKAAERRLHEYAAMQSAILDSANYAIIATDPAGIIRSLNPAAERLTGYAAAELLGEATPALFHDGREVEERARTLSAELGQAVQPGFEVFVAKARRGIAEEREWTYVRKDGRRVPVMLTVSAIREAAGEIMGFLGIASDQSERRHAEQVSMRSDLRMRATLENTPNVAVQWYDGDGRVLYWNKASQGIYGWRAEEAVGRTVDELTKTAEELPEFCRTLAGIGRQGGCLGPLEYVVRHRDGSPRTVMSTIFSIPGEEDEPWFVCMDVDITERKAAEAGLASSQRALMEHNESLRVINQLSNSLHDNLEVEAIVRETVASLHGYSRMPVFGLYLFDPSRALLQLAHSEGFDSDLVHTGETLPLVGSLSGLALMEGRMLLSVDIAEDERLEPHVREALLARNIHYCVVIPLIHSGRPLGTINLIYHERPKLGEIELETFASIGKTVCMALANARHLDDLEYQALHDSLTGLPNRVILHRKFRQFAGESGEARPLAMMLLDLDRFKEINDSMGHHVGDLLLRQISARLEGTLSEDGGVLCRLGGDEFAVLLPELADPVGARAVAQGLLSALRQPFVVEGMALEVDASLGIAMHPQDGSDSGEMLRSADVAMYEAKRKGIGISFYDRELDQHSPERLVLIAEMNGAIREGQLCLYYQPKMDLAHDQILGFEALVRWNHPRFGLLAPDVFMASAEVGEIVHTLTHQVLDTALRQQREWRQQGFDYSVAVNLSARNLIDDRCLKSLQSLMLHYGTEPGKLELEITETALMQDPEGAARLLDRIAELGVKLSIDDFGTGYSSLAYLRRLPISSLKIDRLFVRDMLSNEQDAIIVRSIIGLAHNLGHKVVAEGVENAATQAMLRGMACDIMQGFHLCRPMPWEELESWLAARRK